MALFRATSTANFTGSIGATTFIDSGRSMWSNSKLIVSELAYLGIKHVRDGTPYNEALPVFIALAASGVKFDLEEVNPTPAPFTTVDAAQDVARAAALQKAMSGSVESMEGANEYDLNNYTLNNVGSLGDLNWGALDAQDLQAAVAKNPTLAGVLIVAPATGSNATPTSVLSTYVDASNWHVYGQVGQQLASSLAAGIAAAKATAPGKPVFITETGISSSGYGTAVWGVTDKVTQGIIDVNALLDSYKAGVTRTFLFDLMEDPAFGVQGAGFGLFYADGTPKPVAIDIHNLFTILSDNGSGSVVPGLLPYTISGLPSTASSMLLEKSDGKFELVVWNGNAVLSNGITWNGDQPVLNKTFNIVPPTSDITITFGAMQSGVKVFNVVGGLTPLESLAATTSVTFGLSAAPMVIEVTAAPVLTLHLAEDAYQGNAQFTVTIDSKQLGLAQAVTTLNSSGGSQAFNFNDLLPSGTHDLAVSFTNDFYAGTPQTDRNLYLKSANYNGHPLLGAEVAMYSNETQHFSLMV